MATLKGAPHSREAYNDLFKALYELFMLGRRGGMVALEEHVMSPESSNIFAKYPTFQKQTKAMEFLCNGLRPIIDGKIKPDHLKMLLEIELEAMEEEHERPVSVLTKAADAMPGFGIVAAVLGIVLTMSSISGPIEEIGEKVGAALVGTFLGIFLSYGFMNPLAVNIEFMNLSEMAYIRCIAASVIGFAGGMSPIMAVEVARRGLPSEVKPSADGLETMLKALEPGATGQIDRPEIMAKKAHVGGAWKVAYADFVTAMMALFIVLWLTSQDQRIKEAVARAFAHPFASLTKDSVGILPSKDTQATKSSQGNFDSASAVELAMLRRMNQDFLKVVAGGFFGEGRRRGQTGDDAGRHHDQCV